jgi:2-amino-4-hydroxy-6-hydroxymethyldihydropteridine diphosphokinase
MTGPRADTHAATPADPDAPVLAPGPIVLPPWAVAGSRRRAHIARVVALIGTWATHLAVSPAERQAWHDAALWHDALRDAPEEELRAIVDASAPWILGEVPGGVGFLHGPAAAARLAAGGERRELVLDAIRWHTVGSAQWGATGRALYMADFLEPGRDFAHEERAALAQRVLRDFDAVFHDVVELRVRWATEAGKALAPRTVELWTAIR